MAGQIAIAAASFSYAFAAQAFSYIKGNLKPGESLFLVPTQGRADVQKQILQRTLERIKPVALIGVSIRLDKSTVAGYRAANVPVVIIDEEVPGVSTITSDNFLGGYLAGDYLGRRGRRTIGVVSGRTQVEGGYNAAQRLKGFTSGLETSGLRLPEGGLVEVTTYSYDEGVTAMVQLLEQVKGLDGIFCAAGDVCAMGLLKSAQDRGVSVPGQVAIVGFDDMEIARISTPALTTVRQPIREMAEAAYRLAMQEGADILQKPRRIVHTPELIVRNSA